MLLTESQKVLYKSLLMQTYKAFRKLCIDNDIHYFAGGGTMIGAVRHKGIIPWDDDIDIFMLRKDYDKFISLKRQLNSKEYEIIDSCDKGYFCSMAKFSHRNSSVWEFQEIPYVTGIYLDVFALDFENGSFDEVIKKKFRYDYYSNLFFISSASHSFLLIFKEFSHLNVKKGLWYLVQKFLIRNLRFFFRLQILKSSKLDQGRWLVVYQSIYGKSDIYQASWIQDGFVTLPFEDSFIDVPINYDSILSQVYGDYMTLPPKDKQIAHHARFFLSLDKRITKEEIKQIQSKYQ